jgi:hypothetical protein
MTRTTCKLILAGILLVATSFLPQSAQAGTCCTNCYNQWLSTCWNNCHGDAGCQANCENSYDNCAVNCSRIGQSCPI